MTMEDHKITTEKDFLGNNYYSIQDQNGREVYRCTLDQGMYNGEYYRIYTPDWKYLCNAQMETSLTGTRYLSLYGGSLGSVEKIYEYTDFGGRRYFKIQDMTEVFDRQKENQGKKVEDGQAQNRNTQEGSSASDTTGRGSLQGGGGMLTLLALPIFWFGFCFLHDGGADVLRPIMGVILLAVSLGVLGYHMFKLSDSTLPLKNSLAIMSAVLMLIATGWYYLFTSQLFAAVDDSIGLLLLAWLSPWIFVAIYTYITAKIALTSAKNEGKAATQRVVDPLLSWGILSFAIISFFGELYWEFDDANFKLGIIRNLLVEIPTIFIVGAIIAAMVFGCEKIFEKVTGNKFK